MKETVLIIGFGRFARVLALILKDDFEVLISSRRNVQAECDQLGITAVSLGRGIKKANTIFYAVPISVFKQLFVSHLPIYKQHNSKVIIDVLSVKVHPKKVFKKYLPKGFQAILTHPMFGPDSYKKGKKLPFVIDSYQASAETYNKWKNYFARHFTVIEMDANTHDNHAAYSQGVTHFLGRLLEEFDLQSTSIDTLGAKKMLEIKQQTCNDSWQLFKDLQTYNPYTKKMRVKLGESFRTVYSKLLPDRINSAQLVVGIQGGIGSFNQEAAQYYIQRNGFTQVQLKYLHTTERVLDALHRGEIDRGQFAFNNSTGGAVHETVRAMARHRFEIVEEFGIEISHALMVGKGVKLEEIKTVMTHPQVLKQCKRNLAQKYNNLTLTSGEGDLIDHATVAKHIAKQKLPRSIATMGSKVLADIYDLTIIEDNLQDLKHNFTSFLWVKREDYDSDIQTT